MKASVVGHTESCRRTWSCRRFCRSARRPGWRAGGRDLRCRTLEAGAALKLNGLGAPKRPCSRSVRGRGSCTRESPSGRRARSSRPTRRRPSACVFCATCRRRSSSSVSGGRGANAKGRPRRRRPSTRCSRSFPEVKGRRHADVHLSAGQRHDAIRRGDRAGESSREGFADAVFAIWLGPKPPSDDLKRGMLG